MQERHMEVIVVVPDQYSAVMLRNKLRKLESDVGHLVAQVSGYGVPVVEITAAPNETSKSRNMVYGSVSNMPYPEYIREILQFIFSFLVAQYPNSGVTVRERSQVVSEFVKQAPAGTFVPDEPLPIVPPR